MEGRTQSRSVPLWTTWTFNVRESFCSPLGASPNKRRDVSSLASLQVRARVTHEEAGGGRHRLLVPSNTTLLPHPTKPLFFKCFAKEPPVTSHAHALVVGINLVQRPQTVRLNAQAVPLRMQIA